MASYGAELAGLKSQRRDLQAGLEKAHHAVSASTLTTAIQFRFLLAMESSACLSPL